ncbi:hypothetical protein [Streptomyces wuyuanensis]|uniref:hypothetical protein n=1 Tax=Streptomyces wuyuanensis TaxID=1196353 RepID=UPI00342A862E
MNDAYRAAVVDMLNKGAAADDDRAQLPGVAVGEIAAISETEELTRTRTKVGASPIPDVDPQLAHTLDALIWGENSHTAPIRNLADRTPRQPDRAAAAEARRLSDRGGRGGSRRYNPAPDQGSGQAAASVARRQGDDAGLQHQRSVAGRQAPL